MSTFKFTHNIDEKSPRIEQPDKIIISLKEHQKALIHRARQLENMIPLNIEENKQIIAKFGVICDHVGAGKSYEVLGTIASSPVLSNQSNFITLNDMFHGIKKPSFKFYNSSQKINTNIIAVPHGVFKQWEDYIKKFTKLSCYSINTFQTLRNILVDYKLDEMLVSDDEIHDNVIDGLLEDLRSHKFKPKYTNELFFHKQKQPRDTKYYRYLEPYLNNNPEIVEIVKTYGSLDYQKINNYNIVLISSTMYNELAFYMIKDNYYVNRLIFDEADSINIPNNLKINALFYWFVTSSYESLINPDGIMKKVVKQYPNHYGNSWGSNAAQTYEMMVKEDTIKCNGFIRETFKSIAFDPLRKHYFLKNDNKFIEISFKLPEPNEYLIVSRDNVQIQVLNGIVSNDVLMLLNAGDTNGAINRLTCEKGSEDNIINVVTQRLHDKVKELKEELVEKQGKDYSTPKAKQEALERTQKKIQETNHKIKSIEERIKNIDCCDICFDDITNPAVTGCCQNVFCFACLALAISGKNLCPKCRDSLTLENIMLIKNEKDEDIKAVIKEVETAESLLAKIISDAQTLDKYSNLEKILEYKMKYFTKQKRKILIFSEHEGSFNDKMLGILDKHKILYSRIKGSSACINKTLREYRGEELRHGEVEIDALLINSRFFGAGLNLQNSSDIIILHRQGADLLHQIIGRAQRIGRKDSLNIWKLYNNNEAYNYVES
jgi:hypothetical protein